jgi:hypothetical protein
LIEENNIAMPIENPRIIVELNQGDKSLIKKDRKLEIALVIMKNLGNMRIVECMYCS